MKKLWTLVELYLDAAMEEYALTAKDFMHLVAFAIGCVMWFNPFTGLLWLVISLFSYGSSWFQTAMSLTNFICAFIVSIGGAGWNSKPTFQAFFVSSRIAFVTTFVHLYKVIMMYEEKFYFFIVLFLLSVLVFYKWKRIKRRFRRIFIRMELKLREQAAKKRDVNNHKKNTNHHQSPYHNWGCFYFTSPKLSPAPKCTISGISVL